MPVRLNRRAGLFTLSMTSKLNFAVLCIVSILLLSTMISIVEFRMVGNYVSDTMKDEIESITLATDLSVAADDYNRNILAVVGNADSLSSYKLDFTPFKVASDSLINQLQAKKLPLTSELRIACDDYINSSLDLETVVASTFTDSREWFFNELQPKYNNFCRVLGDFNQSVHENLGVSSENFDDTFYRSIMPVLVSVSVAVVLCLLLLFFILVFYVRPVKRMLKGLDAYTHYGQPYKYSFEGDDELKALNGSIYDIIDENVTLKRRLRSRES